MFYYPKKWQIFQRLLQNISLHMTGVGGQVLGGDEVSFSEPILNFPLLALSHSLRRHLIESVLKAFHCVFPQTLLWIADTFTVCRALVEDAGILLLSLASVTIVHASLRGCVLSGQEEVKTDRRMKQWLFTRNGTEALGEKDTGRSLNCRETVDKLLGTRARATRLPDKDQRPGCITDFLAKKDWSNGDWWEKAGTRALYQRVWHLPAGGALLSLHMDRFDLRPHEEMEAIKETFHHWAASGLLLMFPIVSLCCPALQSTPLPSSDAHRCWQGLH